ncbi:DUF2971 domain-containing protein [Providencia rettgeri]|uniref:DUF2971 domain-containing protein n=1 Tax=Providencia TaxID=586 RepID=UPI001B396D24|nr:MULTISPECIES: DUF2971 domain-containing protein [Providencia]MBQ0208108.1 DUF2971 domain-containing protein [Providencia rettgeri]MDR9614300.1 DUF2971 domain-containing protein [Providencia rettgeri]
MVNEVYKYVPPERIDILESKRICFSKKDQLNDNYEFDFKIKVCREHEDELEFLIDYMLREPDYKTQLALLENIKPMVEQSLNCNMSLKEFLRLMFSMNNDGKNIIRVMLQEIEKKAIESFQEKLCVLCLSNNPNNNFMWGYYTKSYSGFMIGFDSNHSFFNKNTDDVYLMKSLRDVEYVDEIPVLYLKDTIENKNEAGKTIFYNKHSDHSVEQECRILDVIDNAAFVNEAGYHLFDLPKGLITSVTFGHNMSTDNEAEIRNLIENDDYFDGVTMYKAIPNADTRKIDRKLIE